MRITLFMSVDFYSHSSPTLFPGPGTDFLQCKSVRKQAEKLTECVHVLPVEGERRVYNWWCKWWFAQDIWSSVQRHWWYTEHEVHLHEKIKQINNSWFLCVLSPSDSHQLTLDLNTAHKRLCLSENNRVITGTKTDQSCPDHPDRFDCWNQVLFRESVCGRCYWELEWSGDRGVRISVSYKSISRKGQSKECLFGHHDQSWCLFCSPSRYSFLHNKTETALPVKSISSRIGVYVDHSAGTLSFYSVSDTMSLIHTVQTTFTQPLYPGFLVSRGSRVELLMNQNRTDEGFYP